MSSRLRPVKSPSVRDRVSKEEWGVRVLFMSERAAKTVAAQIERPDRPSQYKVWPALLGLPDRKEIHYRN